MIDEFFEVIRLAIPFEQFLTLPRNSAYKYEFFGGRAVLTPRPKVYQAILELRPGPVAEVLDAWGPVRVRPLREDDWEALPSLFASAFHQVPPFVHLDDDRRVEAARRCLEKTRSGGDGPLVGAASFAAVVEEEDRPLGAALVTMERRFDQEEVRALGRDGVLPHLTWIFVAPLRTRHGIGSALLGAVVNALVGLGHDTLASSFLLGNDASTLWHWISGFRLVSYAGSPRSIRAESRRRASADPQGPNREPPHNPGDTAGATRVE